MVKNKIISMLCLAVFSSCMAYGQTNGSSDNVYKKLLEKIEKKQNDQALKEFREKFTFENFLALLDDYENEAVAKKCGLTLLYKDEAIDGEKRNIEVVYGYDVIKGRKQKYHHEIIPKSGNACYVRYCPNCLNDFILGAELFFKSRYDANRFYEQAKEYGMIVYNETTYVPDEKLSGGYHYIDNREDAIEYGARCMLGEIVEIVDGWYCIGFGFDVEY